MRGYGGSLAGSSLADWSTLWSAVASPLQQQDWYKKCVISPKCLRPSGIKLDISGPSTRPGITSAPNSILDHLVPGTQQARDCSDCGRDVSAAGSTSAELGVVILRAMTRNLVWDPGNWESREEHLGSVKHRVKGYRGSVSERRPHRRRSQPRCVRSSLTSEERSFPLWRNGRLGSRSQTRLYGGLSPFRFLRHTGQAGNNRQPYRRVFFLAWKSERYLFTRCNVLMNTEEERARRPERKRPGIPESNGNYNITTKQPGNPPARLWCRPGKSEPRPPLNCGTGFAWAAKGKEPEQPTTFLGDGSLRERKRNNCVRRAGGRTRDAILRDAVRLAKSVNYRSAGTAEFHGGMVV
ncbi:hypothetical protein V8F20_004778 [Naviculisporaceae sp. PSN 640]